MSLRIFRKRPGRETSETTVQGWIFFAAGGLIILFAFLLRIYRIDEQALWIDEAASFYIATDSEWPGSFIEKDTPPLYYLLLRAWIGAFGQTETALRMLSAGFGTLFVVALIWVGREILNPRAGLWSGAFVALAPIHIFYSQEARAYGLLVLLLLLTYGVLWHALKTNQRRWWGLASVCALLSLYTHYFAILGLIPTIFLILLWPERENAKMLVLRYTMAASLSGFLFLPWFFAAFVYRSHSLVGTDWIRDAWNQTPPLLAIPRSLEVFGLGGQAGVYSAVNVKQFGALVFPVWFRIWGAAILLLLGLLVATPWGEERLAIRWLGRKKAWLWTALFFPPLFLWLISFFYKPLYAVGRYEMVSFPAYSLLLGLSLAKVQSIRKIGRLSVFLLALLLLIPIGVKLNLYYGTPSRSSAPKTATLIDRFVENGDVVVFTRLRGLPVLYYLNRLGYRWQERYCVNESAGRRFSCRMFPRETERAPADYDPRRALSSLEEVRDDLQDFLRMLDPQKSVLWVVFGSAGFLEGRLRVPKPDSFLVNELGRLGLKPVPVVASLGVFQFR